MERIPTGGYGATTGGEFAKRTLLMVLAEVKYRHRITIVGCHCLPFSPPYAIDPLRISPAVGIYLPAVSPVPPLLLLARNPRIPWCLPPIAIPKGIKSPGTQTTSIIIRTPKPLDIIPYLTLGIHHHAEHTPHDIIFRIGTVMKPPVGIYHGVVKRGPTIWLDVHST